MLGNMFRTVVVCLAFSPLLACRSVTEVDSLRAAEFEPPPAVDDSTQWKRANWLFETRAYPAGTIPERAYMAAYRELRRQAARSKSNVRAAKWTNIGPQPIDSKISNDVFIDPGEFSGRVATIAVDPKKSKHWLVGAAQGGVWETKNSGKKWFYRTASAPTQAVGAIAFAPSKTKVVYAGTGEGLFGGNVAAGVGVLKSTNGGRSWKLVNQADGTLEGLSFTDLAIDPKNENVIIGGTVRGVRRQSSALPTAGVMRSTNGGTTWTRTLSGQVNSLKVDPGNFMVQYAALGEIFGNAANGLYRSLDGGQSWTKLPGPWDGRSPGRIELAVAPSDPDVVYVSVQESRAGSLVGLWKTENASGRDGGRLVPSWKEIKLESYTIPFFNTKRDDFCDPQCAYDHVLLVDSDDPDLLYAGGVWLWTFNGSKWTQILPAHVDQHALAWAGKTLVAGNDGGVFSAAKPTAGWKSHNAGLALTQFYHGALHPDDFGKMVGGAQDNGTSVHESTARTGSRQLAGNNEWRKIAGGDGGDVEVANDNPDTHWAFAFQFQAIQRTTNAGVSRQAMAGNMNTAAGPFIGVFGMCPSDDDVFVAGTDRVWRIDDFFTTGNPKWSDQKMVLKSATVSSVAFAPSDTKCGIYAIGTSAGDVHVTQNGGKSWTSVGSNLPGRAVTDLAFDPKDSKVLWVTLSGFDENTPGDGHVFRTTAAQSTGAAWTDVGPPVNIPHNAIAIEPGDSDGVWVGTDLGLWEQTGTAANPKWVHHGPGNGLPFVAVFDIQASKKGIAAFTYGRGVFVLK